MLTYMCVLKQELTVFMSSLYSVMPCSRKKIATGQMDLWSQVSKFDALQEPYFMGLP